MPFPLIPLLFGGLNALGGAFGSKDKQRSESTSTSNQTTNQTGNINDVFSRTSTEGFAPGFEGLSADLIQKIFGTLGGGNLDPEQLKRNELASKFKANTQADQLFNSVRGKNASQGLAYSPSSEGLARGISEGYRGSSILDATQNYAQQLFQLPVQQEQLNSSRRSGILNLFNSLPRTQTQSGTSDRTSTGTTTQTGTNTQQGMQQGRTGNPFIDAIVGFMGGFGSMGGFDSLFGGGNGGGNLPMQNIPRTPNYNPDVSSVFQPIQTYGFGNA